jgi:hypothetical protein
MTMSDGALLGKNIRNNKEIEQKTGEGDRIKRDRVYLQ